MEAVTAYYEQQSVLDPISGPAGGDDPRPAADR
jgi:hypothetical protein